MSETVFKKVDYTLGALIESIALGDIGLPDIQRPFVWNNTKVRDLFDSMYRGYPVGYLLFWQNGVDDSRTIGTDSKQKVPKLVIVDGQQRLTSLYAVIKGVSVIRENFESEKIWIAFNPLDGKFEVTDAAILRNKAFIPDISMLWSDKTDIFEVVENYLAEIATTRELLEDDRKKIKNSFKNLYNLLKFPLTALELLSHISEEDVSDVFVRINSKGTPLNQADFILTLMSVFWDEGRAELEKFCRESRKPAKSGPSPFNHFIEPSPDQLLRVSVGLAFKRARLRYVYSILRGKDLETEQFSDERRVEQFGLLKASQDRVLNLQYWHDFMHCLRQAGYRSGRMISSQNNLIFSYILYLIGRTEYGIDEFDLRRIIARWFFMSSITGRFTGSPESQMEFDLAGFREVKDGREFIRILSHICDMTLTNDFWRIRLPNDLATSAARGPALYTYHAALVLLDARVLFSKSKVTDLFDPSVQPIRSIERHHLFPKAFLETQHITEIRDTNQIANYALVEWGDNVQISGQPPAQYLPQYLQRFDKDELKLMYHWHALPENWEHMPYREFLEKRRELIAGVIEEAYQILTAKPVEGTSSDELYLERLVMNGESEFVEFKSALRTNLHTGSKDPRIEHDILRTLAGFLNTNGGTLIIGVADDGNPVGIEVDGFPNEDKMNLHLVNIVRDRMGQTVMTSIHAHYDDYEGSRVMVVNCSKSPAPVYVQDGVDEHFYIRTGPATSKLTTSQAFAYINTRFKP